MGADARQGLLASRTEKLTEKVWTVELVGGCALDYHTSEQARSRMSRSGLSEALALAGDPALAGAGEAPET